MTTVEKEAPAKPATLIAARESYDKSLSRLAKAIEASKVAREKFRAERSESNKTKYDSAKSEHKDAVTEIRKTREIFKKENSKFHAKSA